MRFFQRSSAPRVDRLVVGLGNPGDGYASTRHNVGFQVASRLAKRARAEFSTKAADARIAEGTLAGYKVAIARPQTFMNDSGRSVGKLLDRYRLEPADVLVVYDDVDLPLGRVRIRPKGGPGTHNGVRSVVAEIGDAFPRVRCGVAPVDPRREIDVDLADYVLQPFAADEREAAEAMIARAADAIEVALRDGVEAAMTRFNGADKP
ncbi:MAG: aminoacyl-tRNA hydrolase [Chloroflexota bacterium]|nr:aminoacyl-tRNA hydrolase [Chloroflexota bacterium]MDE3192160.1 aminoacyl-tRNA hydrolase [Chloroflexota bacterium]